MHVRVLDMTAMKCAKPCSRISSLSVLRLSPGASLLGMIPAPAAQYSFASSHILIIDLHIVRINRRHFHPPIK
jgi:hypothetical protein